MYTLVVIPCTNSRTPCNSLTNHQGFANPTLGNPAVLHSFFIFIFMYILCVCIPHNCTVHGADLTNISLLVILCIIVYVTNKNRESCHKGVYAVPWAMRNSTVSRCPSEAAIMSGVRPCLSARFTSAPCDTNRSTIWKRAYRWSVQKRSVEMKLETRDHQLPASGPVSQSWRAAALLSGWAELQKSPAPAASDRPPASLGLLRRTALRTRAGHSTRSSQGHSQTNTCSSSNINTTLSGPVFISPLRVLLKTVLGRNKLTIYLCMYACIYLF